VCRLRSMDADTDAGMVLARLLDPIPGCSRRSSVARLDRDDLDSRQRMGDGDDLANHGNLIGMRRAAVHDEDEASI
jgi:hypothetical protein